MAKPAASRNMFVEMPEARAGRLSVEGADVMNTCCPCFYLQVRNCRHQFFGDVVEEGVSKRWYDGLPRPSTCAFLVFAPSPPKARRCSCSTGNRLVGEILGERGLKKPYVKDPESPAPPRPSTRVFLVFSTALEGHRTELS